MHGARGVRARHPRAATPLFHERMRNLAAQLLLRRVICVACGGRVAARRRRLWGATWRRVLALTRSMGEYVRCTVARDQGETRAHGDGR